MEPNEPRCYARLAAADDPTVQPTPPDLASLICSFCGKSREQVPKLFTGRGVSDPSTGVVIAPVYICNECVALCADTLADEV